MSMLYCAECNAQRSITIDAQREAIQLLSSCLVEIHYLGDGVYKAEYANERIDRIPMISYLTARQLILEAERLNGIRLEKIAMKQQRMRKQVEREEKKESRATKKRRVKPAAKKKRTIKKVVAIKKRAKKLQRKKKGSR